MLTSLDICHAFLKLAESEGGALQFRLTQMKLQKLVFYSQMVSLKMLNIPIHGDETQAWDYGPVCPVLYRKLKKFKSAHFTLTNNEMREVFAPANEVLPKSDAENIIKRVWNNLKDKDAYALSDMTHAAGSAWSEVYKNQKYGVIGHEIMKDCRC